MSENDFVIDLENVETLVQGNIEGSEPPKLSRVNKESYYELSTSQVTNFVLQAGREKASKVFNLYGSLDLLRPYFDVKPSIIMHKLLYSFKPELTYKKLDAELYGPLMIVLTLIALLICEIKTSEHIIGEGTIFGTSFSLCFGYWISASIFLAFLCFLFNININVIQLSTLIGYGLFGHCLIVSIGILYHPPNHTIIYIFIILVAFCTGLRMVLKVMSHIKEVKHKIIIGTILGAFHIFFLLYIHFSFHKLIEEFDTSTHSEMKYPIPPP